ncbi:hypothetical protein SAMD00019534_044450 [Acytostelium subglobosum LB1]|uniref:hypothetical protein n=1 Tax=Acytostelium subglobosum LB1 TaxID=1410327 RepID=UPI000644FC6C|nr:hypothetical protein SAMD00019534_044450 [Acytostelium subglobosum LB1]GAM21270.1 hypothetical protein SAMD00019534_044450 [Acytostelium subglobosum LB1]|eukprot:XP_012755389.1 hypothetical protein SAMD00019534_044450 [Acytostelium subglobosum LB1]
MSDDSNDALVGEINTDQVDQQAWLIKIPKYLADHWMNAGGGSEIGKLYFKSANDLSLSIARASGGSSEEFQLTTTPLNEANPLKIFSEDSENALAFDGSIGLRCDVQMDILSQTYRELMQKRNTMANTKTRQLKPLQDQSSVVKMMHQNSKPQISTAIYNKDKKKSQEEKRERMQEDDLTDLIFKAFEEKSYWTLKDLLVYTEQPQVWLKQVLEKICDFHKKGSHRNCYEVKPEFKAQKLNVAK